MRISDLSVKQVHALVNDTEEDADGKAESESHEHEYGVIKDARAAAPLAANSIRHDHEGCEVNSLRPDELLNDLFKHD